MSESRADRETFVVVVRDRDPAAVQDPPRRLFGERCCVAHVHATTSGPLPLSKRYLFNLDRLDDLSRRRALQVQERGAQVTLIVRQVDADAALELADGGWNVIPAYGDTEHIGVGTLRRALRMVCKDDRVVARGFLLNSVSRPAAGAWRQPAFSQLLRQASEDARAGVSVVAAVMAPQRTGSQWLRDLIGWTVGSEVRVFHEHEVPHAADVWCESRSLADALALEPDRVRRTILRRAALRRALLSARRRYIFMTDRDPVDRLISYFVKRASIWLHERFDDANQRFRDAGEIQRAFEEWLPGQVALHARWFRSTLAEPFGLDVRRAQATADGLPIVHAGPNTLVVVPTERLNALRDAAETEYGADACAPLADNSASARGDAGIVAAFRREVRVPSATAKALYDIPEVAYLRSLAAAESAVARCQQRA